jgi:hypothetical protein
MRVLSSNGYSYVTAVISHILYVIAVTSYIYFISRLLHHIHHDRYGTNIIYMYSVFILRYYDIKLYGR